MNQLLQSLSSGNIAIENIPAPQAKSGELLIQTHKTLISAGTERMLMDFGKASLLGKIKQQPDKVKEVLSKIKTDGLLTTLDAVKAKLDQPIALGYCNVGQVLDAGSSEGFSIGDRVLSNGPHAEIVRVPKNLCVKIPDQVSDEEAVFTVLGAIGLQGIRLLSPTLGECVVVQGLGLIGLIAVQLLIAQGCRVLGADFDAGKLALAKQFGAEVVNLGMGEDLIAKAEQFSRGRGVDAVLITASNKTDEIIHQAATICRKRGRIVLVGVIGLNLRRDDFYKKELSFQVSCSYGPGRYDETYENAGQDYPLAYVRWTEQRNFEAILDMMAMGKLDVRPLISHRFEIEEAGAAYEKLEDKSQLGILLEYPVKVDLARVVTLVTSAQSSALVQTKGEVQVPCVAFLGAGNYASRMLMPAFKKSGAKLKLVVTNQGVSGVVHGRKAEFEQAGTEIQGALQDPSINTLVIATRHDLHAKQVIQALGAGKHIFVEKPLAITEAQLGQITEAYSASQGRSLLMVGFNRRFAPHVQKIKQLLGSLTGPKNFVMTVNAGFIPKDHWTQDPEIGGGRLIGEACHFVDLLRFLAASPIKTSSISGLENLPEGAPRDENISINLKFEDGSQGVIHYFANGHKTFPKERLEVFASGKVLQLDNFRKLRGYGFGGFKKLNLWRQDKGQTECVQAFVDAIAEGKPSPIPALDIFEVTRVCLELREKLEKK